MFAPVKLASMIFAAALTITSVASAKSSCTDQDLLETYPVGQIPVAEVRLQADSIHNDFIAIMKLDVPSPQRCEEDAISRVKNLIKRSDCFVKFVSLNYNYSVDDKVLVENFEILSGLVRAKMHLEAADGPLARSHCEKTQQEEYLEVLVRNIGNLALVRALR